MNDDEEEEMKGFCVACGFRPKSFKGLQACPNCGDSGIPANDDNKVTISVNWHELGILIMWAENWFNSKIATRMNPVYGIAERIRKQHPERAEKMPLTLASEIQQVVDQFGSQNVLHNIPGVEGGKPLEGKG